MPRRLPMPHNPGNVATPLDRICHAKYHRGMIVTIDNAGRLVVPKLFREQFNLTPGCALEIEASADGMTLRRADAEPALARKQGILVHHGATRTALDIADFIRAERNARHARVVR